MKSENVSRTRIKAVTEQVSVQLEELAPIINSFNSEAVQLRLVNEFVIPKLLNAEREAFTNAYIDVSVEYIISACGSLLKGDKSEQIKIFSKCLRTLKDLENDIKAKILSKAECLEN